MSDLAARKLPAIDLDDFERRLRHSPQTAQASDDPLNELARLVAKDDPFKSIFDEMSSSRTAESAPHVQHKVPASPVDLNAAPRLGAPMSYETAFEPPAPVHAGHPSFQTQGDAQHGHQGRASDGYEAGQSFDAYQNAEAQAFDEAPAAGAPDDGFSAYPAVRQGGRRIPRKAMVAGLALSVVAIAGMAAAVGFRGLPKGRSAENTPVIKATAGPFKVQPPQSDTADVAAAPSVLDKSSPADGVANTKVVTREEQPTDIAPVVRTVKTVRIGEGANVAGAAPQAAAIPSASSMPEPKRVKTVLVRPDGSIIGESGTAPAASPPVQAVASPAGLTPSPKAAEVKTPVAKAPDATIATAKSVPAQTVTVVTPVPNAKATARVSPLPPIKPLQVAAVKDIAEANPLQLAAAASAKTRQVKIVAADPVAAPADPVAEEAVQTTSSTTGGGFAVQLAAPGTEQEARDTSNRLQKQFAGALGNYQPGIRKATDKDVYRVRVSNLSKDAADALCGKLKAAGGACFVARN